VGRLWFIVLAANCPEQHQGAKHEEHDAPDHIDVNAQRDGIGSFKHTVARQQHSDQGEHRTNRPANIESHSINFLLVGLFGLPEDQVHDQASEQQHQTDDTWLQIEWHVAGLNFWSERIDQAFQVLVRFLRFGGKRDRHSQQKANDKGK